MTTAAIFERLEGFYGPQEACWPADPYLFLLWWHSGYPASDRTCQRGWESLKRIVGLDPGQLLAAPTPLLAKALAAGGMVPELRALRLKEVAARVENEFRGDLRRGLLASPARARQTLKKFPGIADPGADRILLFGGVTPVAAVPSNCTQVLVRVRRGRERENYGVTYREAQQIIEGEVPENFEARTRAYLLIKRHGQEICKRTNPKCDQCPICTDCAFFAGKGRGRSVTL